MSLAHRVYREKRRLIVPLAAGLVLNAGIYGLAVYPWTLKVRADQLRAAEAAQALQTAQRNFEAARATLTGKDRADAELLKFYRDVLPADSSAARRVTHLRLAQLAQQTNLRHGRRSVKPEHDRDSPLVRVRTTMVLAGDYRDVRRFIHQLETTPEFVVIENVALAQSNERGAPLVLTLDVSTYYWAGGDES